MAEAEAIAAFEQWWNNVPKDRQLLRDPVREAYMAGWIAGRSVPIVDLAALRGEE